MYAAGGAGGYPQHPQGAAPSGPQPGQGPAGPSPYSAGYGAAPQPWMSSAAAPQQPAAAGQHNAGAGVPGAYVPVQPQMFSSQPPQAYGIAMGGGPPQQVRDRAQICIGARGAAWWASERTPPPSLHSRRRQESRSTCRTCRRSTSWPGVRRCCEIRTAASPRSPDGTHRASCLRQLRAPESRPPTPVQPQARPCWAGAPSRGGPSTCSRCSSA